MSFPKDILLHILSSYCDCDTLNSIFSKSPFFGKVKQSEVVQRLEGELWKKYGRRCNVVPTHDKSYCKNVCCRNCKQTIFPYPCFLICRAPPTNISRMSDVIFYTHDGCSHDDSHKSVQECEGKLRKLDEHCKKASKEWYEQLPTKGEKYDCGCFKSWKEEKNNDDYPFSFNIYPSCYVPANSRRFYYCHVCALKKHI